MDEFINEQSEKIKPKRDGLPRRRGDRWIYLFPLAIVFMGGLNLLWWVLAHPAPDVISYEYWIRIREVQGWLMVVIVGAIVGVLGSIIIRSMILLNSHAPIRPEALRWRKATLLTLILAWCVGGVFLIAPLSLGNARALNSRQYDDSLYVLIYDPTVVSSGRFIKLYACDVEGSWCRLVADDIPPHAPYDEMRLIPGSPDRIRIVHPNVDNEVFYEYLPVSDS